VVLVELVVHLVLYNLLLHKLVDLVKDLQVVLDNQLNQQQQQL